MPIYVYEVILPEEPDEDGEMPEPQVFEVMQSMSDEPLTKHPTSGLPVRRVITAPSIMGQYSDHKMSQSVKDDKKLDQLGLTKYVKAGGGYYEKRSGAGPDVISGNDV